MRIATPIVAIINLTVYSSILTHSIAHLARTVLDHDEGTLADGAGLLWVCQRGSGVRGLEVHIVLVSLSLHIRIALKSKAKVARRPGDTGKGPGGAP